MRDITLKAHVSAEIRTAGISGCQSISKLLREIPDGRKTE